MHFRMHRLDPVYLYQQMCAEELSQVDVSAAAPKEEDSFLIFFSNDK